jgi:hypothetical protein
LVRKV